MIVVFDLMWSSALLVLGTVGLACKGGMAPFPAVVTLRYSRVHAGTSDSGYISAKIEGIVNKCFGLRAVL